MPDQTQQDAVLWFGRFLEINKASPDSHAAVIGVRRIRLLCAYIAALEASTPDRDAIARRLLSLHGADLDDLAHARRNVDYLLDGEG